MLHRLANMGLILIIVITATAGSAVAEKSAPRELVMGMIDHFPPYSQVDGVQRRPGGFFIDIVEALARRNGFSVRYVVTESISHYFEELKRGRYDFVAWGVSPPTALSSWRSLRRFKPFRSHCSCVTRRNAFAASLISLVIK